MSTYELQAHSRYLNLPAVPPATGIARHTGYDLIEKNSSGKIISIRSIDLTKKGGKISFEENTANGAAVLTSSIILPSQIKFDDELVDITDEIVEEYDFLTEIIATGNKAKKFFDWIVLDARFREALGKDADVGLIDYDIDGPNCNTWTNYVGQKYAETSNVTELFERGVYTGSSNSFNTGNTAADNNKCILLESYIQKFKSEISSQDYDISDIKIDVNGSSVENWHCIIRDCEVDGKKKTYIYDTAGDCSIRLTDDQDAIAHLEDGNNSIYLGNGNNEIYGGSEYDHIVCGDGNDRVYAGDGENIVNLEGGEDYYEGGNDVDKVTTRNGKSTIYTYAGNDEVDTIIGARTTDINKVYLDDGNDKFKGGVGKDIVYTGSDNDEINTGGGTDVVYTTDGEETDTNTIDLGSGDDEFNGGVGKDIVHGGVGNDKIWGGDGENQLYGDDGNDEIYGGKDKDIVHTGADWNTVHTYAGNDEVNTKGAEKKDVNKIYLGAGGDTFEGGAGRDIVNGGVRDIYSSSIDTESDINEVRLGGGNDEYYGGDGVDKVRGGSNDDEIFGGANGDFLYGDGGNDTLDGGEGNNELYGGTGNDKIYAGSGNDTIKAGTGYDTIRAGSGINHIYLGKDNAEDKVYLHNTTGGVDHIYQYVSGIDIPQATYELVRTEEKGKDLVWHFSNGRRAGIDVALLRRTGAHRRCRPAFFRPPFACSRTLSSGSNPLHIYQQKNLLNGGLFIW